MQAIFDDANYPAQDSRANPYTSNTMGAVSFEYPDGKKFRAPGAGSFRYA